MRLREALEGAEGFLIPQAAQMDFKARSDWLFRISVLWTIFLAGALIVVLFYGG
jgi:hypothetical protein